MEEKIFCVYIMTNKWNTTFYVGVTSGLVGRVFQHQNKLVEGFTKKYNLDKLVYFEVCPSAEAAILREKQIKAGSRAKKVTMIEKMNPQWKDLSDSL
jgi:putative endonuclease